jgi:hypothetical protein
LGRWADVRKEGADGGLRRAFATVREAPNGAGARAEQTSINRRKPC